MKKYIVIFLCLAFIFSCEKNNQLTPNNPKNQENTENNQPWNGHKNQNHENEHNQPEVNPEQNNQNQGDQNHPADNPGNTNQPGEASGNIQDKPSKTTLATRASAQWIANEDLYYKNIDIKKLYNNPSELSAQDLAKYVRFYASTNDGKQYDINDNINEIKISNVSYDGNYITFNVVYNNVKSLIKTSLSFEKGKYLNYHLSINRDNIANYVTSAVNANPTNFFDNIFDYNHDDFQFDEIESGSILDANGTSLTFSITMQLKGINGRTEYASTHIVVNGFMSLNKFFDGVYFVQSYTMMEEIEKALERAQKSAILKGKPLVEQIRPTFFNKKLMYTSQIGYVKDSENTIHLSWMDKNISGNIAYYVPDLEFNLTDAIRDGRNLNIIVNLIDADNVYIDKNFTIKIHSVFNDEN